MLCGNARGKASILCVVLAVMFQLIPYELKKLSVVLR